ncbi:MAG: GrpB family protein [Rhizomicrobium sp.]
MIDTIPVELVPHSPLWSEMAAAETLRLKGALGDVLVTVHHMGSTAIPGIMAKPIVDMIPIVTDLDALDAATPRVVALGYKSFGEFGIPTRRYFNWTDPVTGKRTFQLHCFAGDSPQIARHLAFRDYLRAHPAKAREYEAEKIRAAALHPDNTLDYNAEKNDWIKATEIVALEWVAGKIK